MKKNNYRTDEMRKYYREYYAANKEHKKKLAKKSRDKIENKIARQEYFKRYVEKNKEKLLAYKRKWIEENREKIRAYHRNWQHAQSQYRKIVDDPTTRKKKNAARDVTRRRIKQGIIEKLPCEKCGNKIADAHHNDYENPLDVTWLCRKHHSEVHVDLKTKNYRRE